MLESPEPSEWFLSHFGEHSLQVMSALVSAGVAAHERSLEAKHGSGLRTNDAYGTFWLSLREEVVTHLAFLPGVETIRPTRGRYQLPVFNQMVLFSAKCPAGTVGPDRMKLGRSGVVTRIFDVEERDSVSEPLDFGSLELEEEAQQDFAALPASLGSATKLAFVAYDCTAQGGMQHVYIGDATLLQDGSVLWLYREELPMPALIVAPTLLTLIDDEPIRRFDDAPLPTNLLRLLNEGEAAEADPVLDGEGTAAANAPDGS